MNTKNQMDNPLVKDLLRTSKKVIRSASLPNGAVIAADSDLSGYPPAVQNYRYVWVRDAAYTCIAADLLGLPSIPEKFFHWCLNRAEGFSRTGLFVNAYNTNGTITGTLIPPANVIVPQKTKNKYVHIIHHGTQFQPDQSGSLLVAIDHHIKHSGAHISKFEKLIEKTASGIARVWNADSFTVPCFDLWEERLIPAGRKRYHTYSLAICIAGLRRAINLLGKKPKWSRTEKQMSSVFTRICSSNSRFLPRTFTASAKGHKTEKEDSLPDSSLLGLLYPAGLLEPYDKIITRTIDRIVARNTVQNGGLLRYPRDRYTGRINNGWICLSKAGPWPLLNFWLAIAYSLRGDRKNALKAFNWPLKKIEKFLPEQILKKNQPSVTPLTWAHAMFVIAHHHLRAL